MALTADICTLLTNAGVTNVYRGSMPDKPDNCVVVFRSGGMTRDLSGSMVEEPTFQIRIRNTAYDTGEALCDTVKDALHGVHAVSSGGGDDILLIAQVGDALDIGRDESQRQEWTLNFRAYWRRV